MKSIPKIAESEWQILKIIWENPKITANEIIKNIKGKEDWKASTIKTLINRLLKKNAIGFDKVGKEYLYYPLISKDECIIKESQSFLDRVFNGSLNNMLLNFVKSDNLSKADIEELKNILNKNDEEKI